MIKDVGKVGKGEKIAQDFVIKNEGDAPLEITDVKPTCGCTVAEFDHTIAPGGTGKIHAVVDTTDFGGPISKTIFVYTNDPDNARVELAVKAEVQPYVFVLPGFARFIQPQGSEPGSVEEIMFTGSFDDLEITKAESPYPFMTVTYRPAREEERREQGQGKQWVLTFTVDYKKTPIGTLADFVTVYTNHPKQPIVRIPVSGFVRPMIAVTPPEADFGEIDLSTPQEATADRPQLRPRGHPGDLGRDRRTRRARRGDLDRGGQTLRPPRHLHPGDGQGRLQRHHHPAHRPAP